MPITMPDAQDPQSRLDYKVKWTRWLAAVGDTIAASTWTSADAALVVENSTFTNTETIVWVRGGVAGATYLITNRIVTSQGRTDERTLKIKIKDA